MNSLSELQRQLQAHVLHGAPAVACSVECSQGISAETRLKTYYDAYRLRMIEALESNYPVLAEWLGEDMFAELALGYLQSQPSRRFSIRWFGDALPAYLDELHRDQTWFGELARWEWATTTAFDASDETILNEEAFTQVSPTQSPALRFGVHPSVQRLRLRTNAAQFVKAAVEHLSFPEPRIESATTEWCVWRRDLQVHYRSLTDDEAMAFDALRVGANFAEMCAALAEHVPAQEVPALAASYLKRWINDQWLSEIVDS